MSASLVGSEMCIRDSQCTSHLSSDYPMTMLGRHAQRCDHSTARHTQPVSYTHLTLPTICSV
eukprot:15027022-Alexandrium_andersonii.AAC.1